MNKIIVKKQRIDFSDKTKEIIARRAGFKCSFPGCNKTLVGPGVFSHESITIGECAHIFSAVPKGPRTDGGLNDDELKKPENGIYLCRNHHKIVDSKAKDNKYTSDLLTRYKNRHEFLISAELGEYTYPINWINHIKVQGTVFKNPIELNLGKVTLITGSNATGKSTIVEIMDSVFKQKIYSRWNKPNVNFSTEVRLDNPVLSKFTAHIQNNQLFFNIGKSKQPFVPYDYFVLYLKNEIRQNVDDLKTIADCFGLERSFVKSMLNTTGIKHGLKTRKMEIVEKRTKPYVVDKLNVDIGNWWPQSLGSCSGTEYSNVILDIAISFATEISKFKSVLLLIDWPPLYSFDDLNIKIYLDYLQNSQAHFQTIFVSHNPRPKLDWSGWAIAKMIKDDEGIKVIQNKK
ncbi:HNH endonuclease [Flavobacterium sp. DGU11]|uniref:HNH endonuclease n=1 Tax=Flavobacterium arundinis TaxID=3139143 RepID=A0ABU9HVP4_9FLAO